MFTKKQVGKYSALIHFDETDKMYTLMSKNRGGAIVSDVNLEQAKKDFQVMMKISEVVQRILILKSKK